MEYNVNMKQVAAGVGLVFNGVVEIMKALSDEDGNLVIVQADPMPDKDEKPSAPAEEPSTPDTSPEEEKPVEKPAETPVTLVDVRTALANLSKKGLTAEVKSLLSAHGGTKLSDIDPANYAALLAAAKELECNA